jgi:GntR family transcriptional regulator / MocR family aminotransferase
MIELTPFLDKRINTPLYVQLYTYIKKEIETGGIPTNSLLPSIRYLSEHLKVSKNTIENAYQQLVAEGYAESKPRSGLIVLEIEAPPQPLRSLMDSVAGGAVTNSQTKWRYDFKYGDIDSHHFPLKLWRRCLQDSIIESESDLFIYGDSRGDNGLRTEIASYLFQARGVICSPDQIVMCSGTQNAISLICQLLSLNGKSIAFEEPGYDGVRAVFANHGCSIVPIPLEQDGIDITRLEKSREKLIYITPSHQFPCGMVLPIQKRLKLLEWANQNASYIIEDDYDSEFRYQGQPVPSLKALDSNENVIYLGTFSKCFLPAARMSYLVLPPELLNVLRERLPHYNQSSSPIIQKAMYLFMKHGYFERHVRKMRKIYQSKHRALLQAIDEYLGNRVEVVGSKAGLHLLLRVENPLGEDLVENASTHGVKVYQTDKYWLNRQHGEPSLIMLGFGGLTEKEIGEGVQLLHKAWFTYIVV